MDLLKEKKHFFCTAFLSGLIMLTGCKVKPVENVDFKAVNKEINSRKIKRLNDTEVNQFMYQAARDLADKAKSLLEKNDSSVCLEKEFAFWQADDRELMEAFEVVCELPTAAEGKEGQVWEAYRYNAENNLKSEENLQRIGPNAFLYTLPLLPENTASPFFLRMVLDQKEVIKRVNMKEVLRQK